MKYTEKIHAEGLLEIFSQEKPCGHCPSKVMRKRFGVARWDGEGWDEWGMDLEPNCNICWDFIRARKRTDGWSTCPCCGDNEARAAKLTWLALEAKGYLE